ncbi:hypothetical protein JK359_35150 [Streptomyces actinomycinicus]|uniref:Uncharacterized protein n=1 Tax=Streptomyces actinomycinicus TaxID=1695166 RepID=A0A937JS65_9ACTN|nr:hypothetical protein [Streptomyces actinomycinicus]MBL1087146.1 hypothetical protein [Streptomyces actinomycinicus]
MTHSRENRTGRTVLGAATVPMGLIDGAFVRAVLSTVALGCLARALLLVRPPAVPGGPRAAG